MLDTPMMDPLTVILKEFLADDDLRALTHGRVRLEEAAPGDAQGPGTAASPAKYQAFVVLSSFENLPDPSLPVQRSIIGVTCYGATFENARSVWGAVVKTIHYVTARLAANGLGIYFSAIESGGESDRDPQTNQPLYRGTIVVRATAFALT